MRILIVTQYFYPEPGAATNRLLSFARGLARNGHDITVLCEFPSYPSGVLARQYRFKLFKIERFENFRIVRAFILPTTRFGILSRLLNYASYLFSSFVVGLFLRRPHIMIASSPPPLKRWPRAPSCPPVGYAVMTTFARALPVPT